MRYFRVFSPPNLWWPREQQKCNLGVPAHPMFHSFPLHDSPDFPFPFPGDTFPRSQNTVATWSLRNWEDPRNTATPMPTPCVLLKFHMWTFPQVPICHHRTCIHSSRWYRKGTLWILFVRLIDKPLNQDSSTSKRMPFQSPIHAEARVSDPLYWRVASDSGPELRIVLGVHGQPMLVWCRVLFIGLLNVTHYSGAW